MHTAPRYAHRNLHPVMAGKWARLELSRHGHCTYNTVSNPAESDEMPAHKRECTRTQYCLHLLTGFGDPSQVMTAKERSGAAAKEKQGGSGRQMAHPVNKVTSWAISSDATG